MNGKRLSTAQVEARIRRLCCAGLSSEVVIPVLLRELHALVPSCGNGFFWVNQQGQLSNVYDESPEFADVVPLYAAEFYNRRELEIHPGFEHAVRTQRGVVRMEEVLTVDKRQLHRSDLYNLIMRPMHYSHAVQLYVREGGPTLGVLQLCRSYNEREFTAAEVRRLGRLEPFVAHALAARPWTEQAPWVDSGESGLIIADRKGRPLSFSPGGRRLLYLATHPRLTRRTAMRSPWPRLPAGIVTLCRSLSGVLEDDLGVPAPVARYRNAWGSFTFRAYQLGEHGSDANRVGITVAHEEPLLLRLTRASWRLPLSPRQADVAVLLALGLSHQQVGDRLGISRETAVSHSRWVHSKLGVHDSGGVHAALMSASLPTEESTVVIDHAL